MSPENRNFLCGPSILNEVYCMRIYKLYWPYLQSGNTPEDYLQSPGMNHLDPNDTVANLLSPEPSPRRRSRGPARSPSKSPGRSPSRAPSKSPARASKASLRESKKDPPRKSPRYKTNNKFSKGKPSKPPPKKKSKEASRNASRGPSKNNSRASSRAPTPSDSTDGEIRAAILAAENDENFKLLNDIIKRGDGNKLLGQSSKDSDVDDFLKKVPQHLEAIQDLHLAVEKGESRKVMSLLDKKQRAYTKDANQASILHKAVLHGHTDMVRYLVSSFPDLLKEKDMAGRTPLHYAAVIRDGGHIYKILGKADADDNIKDDSGHTPKDYIDDPELLTQWDLIRELENDDAESDGDSRSRPITKESIVVPQLTLIDNLFVLNKIRIVVFSAEQRKIPPKVTSQEATTLVDSWYTRSSNR
ncbi:hypothetical protein SK128_023325 [Halocaridina rubra]|uniref:Uncharacterized protein n=1 Tax=Halocaridina rubra TaxID=373956 RepID=A0AAN9A942_HALRR